MLLSTGEAVYEVDVEVKPQGEFNVYVDAATGKLHTVDLEYWEIGEPDTDDQLGGTSQSGGSN